MNGATVYQMISGLGDAFGDAYAGARKQAQEDEAPGRITDLLGARAAMEGGGAPPATAAADTTGAPTAAAPIFAANSGSIGDYLAQTRARESGGNDLAANPNSTAKGRYQFTDQTWAGVAKRHPDLGLTPGGWRDPAQQEKAMQAFTADNARALTAAGLPINPANLYGSHFLGEAGGPKFIAGALRDPNQPATALVSPGAAMANRSVFFGKDGRTKTAGEVYAWLGGSQPARSAPPAATTVASAEPDAADLPAQGSQPAGFVVPGQDAPAAAAPAGFAGFGSGASRMTPEMRDALNAAWKNPNTRSIAASMMSSMLQGKDASWQLSTMGDQPVLFNARTAQVIPIGQAKPQTATVGNNLVDTRTGQVIFSAPDKDENKLQSVAPGSTLYDPRARQPVFTAPAVEKDEASKITAQIGAREAEGQRLGLTPGTPLAQTYALTGKIGRDQELSATDKQAIQEADEGVLAARTAIEALTQAKQLSKQAYEGPTAGARSAVTSLFGSDAGVATEDLNNVIMTNALGQLKAIFGGNPTEGERKILLEMQGSVNKPDAVRQKIFDRGMALAQKRLDFNQRRADDLRGGTYYKQDGAASQGKAAVAKGADRTAIPDGKSAGMAVAEARAFVKANPQLKAQAAERLRSWGIDPARLD